MISKFRILIFWLLVPFLPLSGCGGGSNTAPPASPLVGITVSPNTTITTNEYSQTATVSISLGSIPAADVTIPVSSSDTTEGTVDKTSLVFTKTDWSTPQTITITGVNDTIADGDQSYSIKLGPAISASSSSYNAMEKYIPAVNLDVVDGSFVIPAISGHTSESATTATFTVRLGSAPIADVTIPVESSNTAEGTIDKSSLLFTSSNWNQDQTVTVTGVGDIYADGPVAYDIQLGAVSSTDPKYSGLDPADVSVINDSVKRGAIIASTISSYTDESGKTAFFTVHLNIAPAANVTIPVSSSNLNKGTVSTSLLTFTSANYSSDQTVTVTGVDDNIADGNQSYSIVLGTTTSTDDNFNALDPADVSVTNVDLVDPYGVTPRISAGNYHNLVLAGDGTVWGWGKCENGQLDDGVVPTTCPGVSGQTFPQRLNITKAAAVSAGADFSAIVKADGTVWTSGVNDNNQLGHTGGGAGSSLAQVQNYDGVGFLTNITSVSAGGSHILALTNNLDPLYPQTVLAWGNGIPGQLGNGVATSSLTPVQATLPAGTVITAIAASYLHSLALDSTGKVYAWGSDGNGRLGLSATDDTSPTPNFNALLTGVTAIGAGNEYSFAVGSYSTVSDTYAWGSNNDLQLGAAAGDKAVPAAVNGTLTNLVVPTRIDGGFQHSLALVGTTVYVWGDNDNTDGSESWNNSGALGKGNTTDCDVPTTTTFSSTATDISAGYNYSLVLLNDGRIYSSGVNNYSQLGTNLIATSTYTASPVAVEDPADSASFYAYRPILSGQPATSTPSTTTTITVCAAAVSAYCTGITHYIYSIDSGATWSAVTPIATPISLSSLTGTVSLWVKGMKGTSTATDMLQTDTSAVKVSWTVN